RHVGVGGELSIAKSSQGGGGSSGGRVTRPWGASCVYGWSTLQLLGACCLLSQSSSRLVRALGVEIELRNVRAGHRVTVANSAFGSQQFAWVRASVRKNELAEKSWEGAGTYTASGEGAGGRYKYRSGTIRARERQATLLNVSMALLPKVKDNAID
ncbi:unnamed protein product, partial [Ectocarpus sp. 4 AP-2014]